MTNERNPWLMDDATRKAVAHALWGVVDLTKPWVIDTFAALRAALPDLVERDKWRAERVVAESLRTRVAELEAANRKLHARRFAVCDTLGLLARDENGEILNDPAPEDVIGAIEALQGRAERRAPLAASVEELTDEQIRECVDVFQHTPSNRDSLADWRATIAHAFSLLARPAAAPSVAPASPATGALSDEQVDECIRAAWTDPEDFQHAEWVVNRRRDVVRRVLARAATFATAATPIASGVKEIQARAVDPGDEVFVTGGWQRVRARSNISHNRTLLDFGHWTHNVESDSLVTVRAAPAPAAPVEASEAQPDYWTRVEIEHASRELARMESFREQDIGIAFKIAATFAAAARAALEEPK
jgi:hypothetical protein